MAGIKRSADGSITDNLNSVSRPGITISIQPQKYGLRFRYGCENRTPSIMGEGTSDDHKYYVTIKLVNCKEAKLVVSCVTSDKPYVPHPHKLVGKHCKNGVFRGSVNGTYEFKELGLEIVKKKDVQSSLEARKSQNVNPFKNSETQASSKIDLSTVRLCFQPFLKTHDSYQPLSPVVSDPILDSRKYEKLRISRVSCRSGPAHGGTDVMIFCTKLQSKGDVRIEFVNEQAENETIATVKLKPDQIHQQYGVYFKLPPYPRLIEKPHKVLYRLCCNSEASGFESFEYQPSPSNQLPIAERTDLKSVKKERIKNSDIPTVLLSDSLDSEDVKVDPQVLLQSEASSAPQQDSTVGVTEVSGTTASLEGMTLDDISELIRLPDNVPSTQTVQKQEDAQAYAPTPEFYDSQAETPVSNESSNLPALSYDEQSLQTQALEAIVQDSITSQNQLIVFKVLDDGTCVRATEEDRSNPSLNFVLVEQKPNGECQSVSQAHLF